MAIRARNLLIALGMGVLGCGGEGVEDRQVGDAPVSYRHDAQVVLERYCTGCHQAGGIGPFALTSYGAASGAAAAIKASVESGRMPPWGPTERGVDLRWSRALRPQDRALLLAWVDQGAKEGGADERPRMDIPPAEVAPALPREDLVLDPGVVYQPKTGRADDYRCFLIDPKLDQDVWVSAAQVRPDNEAIVHHVLAFEITADQVAGLRAQEGKDGLPGYTCFGGPGVSSPRVVMGWAPGGVPMRMPMESGLRLRKGSWLSMQVHYNLQAYKGVGDRTTTVMELSREAPRSEAYVMPFANPRGLKIDAQNNKQTVSLPLGLIQNFMKIPSGDMFIFANAPHMHLRGKRIATSVNDQLLVEINRWDFHWQQTFAFVEPVRVRSGDTINVECEYDNSALKAGESVKWGEGTNDEMCLSFLTGIPVP